MRAMYSQWLGVRVGAAADQVGAILAGLQQTAPLQPESREALLREDADFEFDVAQALGARSSWR